MGSVLRINVEAGGLRVGGISRTAFATAWCGLTAVWTVGVLGTSPIAGFFSVPFWAAGWRMGKSVWREMFGSLEIQMVVDGKYRMVERTRRRGGKGVENVVMEGRTDELRGATALQMGDENHSVGLGILSGVNGVRGETVLVGEGVLCRRDVLCIVEEINSFLLYHGLLSRMALTQGII